MNSVNEDHQVGEGRDEHDGNPVIQTTVDALHAFGANLTRTTAAELLALWAHAGDLTGREVQAVLSHFLADEMPQRHQRHDDEQHDEHGAGASGPGWPLTRERFAPGDEIQWWQP